MTTQSDEKFAGLCIYCVPIVNICAQMVYYVIFCMQIGNITMLDVASSLPPSLSPFYGGGQARDLIEYILSLTTAMASRRVDLPEVMRTFWTSAIPEGRFGFVASSGALRIGELQYVILPTPIGSCGVLYTDFLGRLWGVTLIARLSQLTWSPFDSCSLILVRAANFHEDVCPC